MVRRLKLARDLFWDVRRLSRLHRIQPAPANCSMGRNWNWVGDVTFGRPTEQNSAAVQAEGARENQLDQEE